MATSRTTRVSQVTNRGKTVTGSNQKMKRHVEWDVKSCYPDRIPPFVVHILTNRLWILQLEA